MRAPAFELVRARDVDAALEALARGGSDARVIAGGQSLGPMLSYQLIEPTLLIDINGLPELSAIGADADALTIGATVTESRIEHSPEVAEAAPLLAEASSWIAHPAVRERGTIGGSVAHNDPGGEYAPVLIALDASVRIRSTRGERTSDVASLVEGRYYETGLEPDEVIVEVRVPRRSATTGHGFAEYADRKGDYAIAGAAAALTLGEGGKVTDLRLCGVGGLYPMRLRSAEAALVGEALGDAALGAAADAAAAEFPAGTDIHADEAYRRTLFRTLAFRAPLIQARRPLPSSRGDHRGPRVPPYLAGRLFVIPKPGCASSNPGVRSARLRAWPFECPGRQREEDDAEPLGIAPDPSGLRTGARDLAVRHRVLVLG